MNGPDPSARRPTGPLRGDGSTSRARGRDRCADVVLAGQLARAPTADDVLDVVLLARRDRRTATSERGVDDLQLGRGQLEPEGDLARAVIRSSSMRFAWLDQTVAQLQSRALARRPATPLALGAHVGGRTALGPAVGRGDDRSRAVRCPTWPGPALAVARRGGPGSARLTGGGLAGGRLAPAAAARGRSSSCQRRRRSRRRSGRCRAARRSRPAARSRGRRCRT